MTCHSHQFVIPAAVLLAVCVPIIAAWLVIEIRILWKSRKDR